MEYAEHFYKLVQIIFVDLVLAGDNAIIIGMVAAGFTKEYRRKVILYGVGVAVILRIVFALITVQLLAIKGLLIIGGLLLLWICWKLYVDLRSPYLTPIPAADSQTEAEEESEKSNPPLHKAIFNIVLADVSMSLDNVLAVAGIADGHSGLLVIGLALSVFFMTVAAALIADILQKHRWIGFVGLMVILYVGLKMVWEGYLQLVQ